jgi:hypothetical protein
MNTKLVFNEETYEFNYSLGIDEKRNTYECWSVYINGEDTTDWTLEEGTSNYYKAGKQVVDRIYLLNYKGNYVGVSINDFSLENVVKVVNRIKEYSEKHQFPIGMKQASSKEALNHLFNKNK